MSCAVPVSMVTADADSPHLAVGGVKGELYLAFAEVDPSVPANVVPDLKAALDKSKVKHTLETVAPGCRHSRTTWALNGLG